MSIISSVNCTLIMSITTPTLNQINHDYHIVSNYNYCLAVVEPTPILYDNTKINRRIKVFFFFYFFHN